MPTAIRRHAAPAGERQQREAWRLISLLNGYRLVLAALLLLLHFSDHLLHPIGNQNLPLLVNTSLVYFLIGLLLLPLIRRRLFRLEILIHSSIGIDILATTLLLHASGGITSGLGALMIIPIACGSMLLSGPAALLPAAIAAICILLEQGYAMLQGISYDKTYLQTGLMGMSYFAIALMVIVLSRRIRESEALAARRGIDLENMAQLTEHVIQRMQMGIIVVDHDLQIRLINTSAKCLLGLSGKAQHKRLKQISPALAQELRQWQKTPHKAAEAFRPSANHVSIMPHFSHIGADSSNATLIYLEDTTALAQQAQQLQLASLGRLTASIAHEIRNPLGAISHAEQLLSESEHLDGHEQRLTQIISDNSRRLNNIIENIMLVSRRTPSKAELFELKGFLEKFLHDYLIVQDADHNDFEITVEPGDIHIRFDPAHLHQIMVNLCDNALRFSQDYAGQPKVIIRGACDNNGSKRPFLDVIDHGPGIATEDIPHLFEPFFTKSATDSGLGLYISRQLAESNQAQLHYVDIGEGACFRILFQDQCRHID